MVQKSPILDGFIFICRYIMIDRRILASQITTSEGQVKTSFSVETQQGSYDLKAHVFPIGKDVMVAIWGGDKPHIGAVSTSLPRPSLEDPSVVSATASTICFPGHKEDELTRNIAQKLSSALNAHVVVAAGAHWKTIDKDGIKTVMQNSKILTDLILARLMSPDSD